MRPHVSLTRYGLYEKSILGDFQAFSKKKNMLTTCRCLAVHLVFLDVSRLLLWRFLCSRVGKARQKLDHIQDIDLQAHCWSWFHLAESHCRTVSKSTLCLSLFAHRFCLICRLFNVSETNFQLHGSQLIKIDCKATPQITCISNKGSTTSF
jgi:hypothetical protein